MTTLSQVCTSFVLTHANPIPGVLRYVLTHANPIPGVPHVLTDVKPFPGVSQLCANLYKPYARSVPATPTLYQVCPGSVLTHANPIPGVSQLSCEPDVLHYLDHKSLQLEHTTLLGNFTMDPIMD
jgi:hypothetical protein